MKNTHSLTSSNTTAAASSRSATSIQEPFPAKMAGKPWPNAAAKAPSARPDHKEGRASAAHPAKPHRRLSAGHSISRARGLGEMTRRKREITDLANEQNFPHLVELALPP